jgi:hypothetical protein
MIGVRQGRRRTIPLLFAACLVFAAACKKSAGPPSAGRTAALLRGGQPAGRAADVQKGRELTAQEVRRCGFAPVFVNKTFMGYRPEASLAATPPNYTFPTAATINELKVSLMLARTCSDVIANHAERVDPPCNDGLGLFNLHAKDAAFLGAVGAQADGRPDQCVRYLVGHLTVPATFEKYAGLLDATVQRNRKMNAEFRTYWKRHSAGAVQAE